MLPDQNRVPRPLRVIQTVVGAPNILIEQESLTRAAKAEMDRVIKNSYLRLWENHARKPLPALARNWF